MAVGKEEAGAVMMRGGRPVANGFSRFALIAIAATLVPAFQGLAAEQAIDRLSAWEVALVIPDSGENPYCDVRTVTWAAKRLSVQQTLTGLDQVETSIVLHKDGWDLPKGENTTVNVLRGAMPFPFPLNFTVSDPDTLRDVPAADKSDMMARLMIATIFKGGKPDGLVLRFSGDEEQWVVPAMMLRETYQLERAIGECQAALTAKGPGLFGNGQATAKPSTSPFAKKPGGDAPTAPQQPATPAPAVPDVAQANSPWEFSKQEEDWGETCYAETTLGDVKVGFMASPGNDIVGYVGGFFQGNARATWRVDIGLPNVSDGEVSDYSGLHEFGPFDTAFLEEIERGNSLAITGTTGDRIAVNLIGALTAIPAFAACHDQPPSPSHN